MTFFEKLSNGWNLSMSSLKVLKANKKLIIFPVLSGISIVLIMGSFVVAILASAGWDFTALRTENRTQHYIVGFLFYVLNYFVVVFFNTALVQCTRDYFNGEIPSVEKGLRFSLSRIGAIFVWSLFAATVGFILRLIQENVGSLGKIITGLFGIVWSIATFFVVPVIAYESMNPIQAIKRSTQMMKEKWGERIGAGFSFVLLTLLGCIGAIILGFLVGYLINPLVGIGIGMLGFFAVAAMASATKTIFISAVYHNIHGDPVEQFDQKHLDNLFYSK